jgi:hypothetical protein
VPGSPKQQSRYQQNAEKGGRCERDEEGKNDPESESNRPECPRNQSAESIILNPNFSAEGERVGMNASGQTVSGGANSRLR